MQPVYVILEFPNMHDDANPKDIAEEVGRLVNVDPDGDRDGIQCSVITAWKSGDKSEVVCNF